MVHIPVGLYTAIVRHREGGGYEIVAGHRRKHACEQAGLETMPCLAGFSNPEIIVII